MSLFVSHSVLLHEPHWTLHLAVIQIYFLFFIFLLMLLKAKFGAVFINFSPLSGFCVDKLTLLGLLFVSVTLAVRRKCF